MVIQEKHTAYPENAKEFLKNGQPIGISLARLPVVRKMWADTRELSQNTAASWFWLMFFYKNAWGGRQDSNMLRYIIIAVKLWKEEIS